MSHHERSLEDDVTLAKACALQLAPALSECHRIFGPVLERTLKKMNLTPTMYADVTQQFWSYMLADDGSGVPYISKYEGRGPLGAWFKVIAARMALKALRSSKRMQNELTLEGLSRLADPIQQGTDVQYMHLLYQGEFKEAFRAAIDLLSDRDKSLLQDHIIDGRSIDVIAEHYGVHRATAARWVHKAKEELRHHVERLMRTKLNITEDTYSSVVALMRSRLELSVQLFFDPDQQPTDS